MQKVSVKENYFYNLVYQILIVVLPIVVTPYLSRVLGAKSVGIYNYTLSIATYFVLFGTMGMSLFGQREVAYYQQDIKKRSEIFYSLLFLRIIFMFLAISVYLILFINNKYSLYYFILLIHLFANLVDISWFYQGLENFKSVVIKNIFIKLIYIISIFIFIKEPSNLWEYILIYSASNFIGNISLWININKYVTKPFKTHPFIYLPGIMILFIPQVANEIYTVFDKTMIGMITSNMNQVAFYGQTQKIVKLILSMITAIAVVVMPRIASLNSKGDNKKINYYMEKTFNYIFILSCPLTFGIISVSDSFVPLFFGEGYNDVILLLKLMSLIIIPLCFSNILGTQYLLPLKRQKEYNISIVVGAIMNFCLNIFLIKIYGVTGAVISTIISEVIITIIQIVYVKKEFNLKTYLLKLIKYVIISIIMFIICELIEYFMGYGITTLILQVLVGSISYLIILLIIKDKFLQYCIGLVKQKLKL